MCIGKVVVSTGIVENMAYAGLVYYEEKRAKDLVTFTAAKKLSALIEVHVQCIANDSFIDCFIVH